MFKIKELIEATGGVLLQGPLFSSVKGICTDSRSLQAQEAFLALRGDNFNGHDFLAQALKLKANCLIVDQDLTIRVADSVAVIKVKNTTLALGQIGRFRREKINLPVIAVTGSNGKTTTKEMIAWVLSAKSRVLKNEGTKNNQIGLPQTLIQLSAKDKFAVVEIGTNHFGEVKYLAQIARPNIGVLTNIGPSHLEFLKNLKGVLREKVTLLDNLAAPAIALLNADDGLLRGLMSVAGKNRTIFSYGIKEKSDFCASQIVLKKGKVTFKVNAKYVFELSTLGDYNIYNALCAIAVGRLCGLSYPLLRARLATFKFPKGRLNLVQRGGLNFIDDTYNSNPLSLSAALSALAAARCKGKKIFVMGDMLELGQRKELLHREFAWSITNSCDRLVAVGKLARLSAAAALAAGWPAENIFCCTSVTEAKKILFNKIKPGGDDLILVKGSRSMKMEEVLKV